MEKVGMGFGVGAISGIYLKNMTALFKETRGGGVCDLVREKAERHGGIRRCRKYTTPCMTCLQMPEIDIVLNLTRPYEHYASDKSSPEAGKHVYRKSPWQRRLRKERPWWTWPKR